MTNRMALVLFAVIVLCLAGDYYFGWGIAILLGQKLLGLLDALAIWR